MLAFHKILLTPFSNNWLWLSEEPLICVLFIQTWQTLTAWDAGYCENADMAMHSTKQWLLAQRGDAVLFIDMLPDQHSLTVELVDHLSNSYRETFQFETPPSELLPSVTDLIHMSNQLVLWVARMMDIHLYEPTENFTLCQNRGTLAWLALHALSSNTVYCSAESWARLESSAQALLKAEPTHHFIPWQVLGHKARQQRQYNKAVECFKHALATLSKDWYWLKAKDANFCGICATLAGQNALAVEWFKLAISLFPDLPAPHLNLGLAMEELGQTKEAIAQLEQYANSLPGDIRSAIALGRLYTMEGEWDKALLHIDRQKALSPGDPWILCNQATLCLHKGDISTACHLLKQVLHDYPDDSSGEYARMVMSAYEAKVM